MEERSKTDLSSFFLFVVRSFSAAFHNELIDFEYPNLSVYQGVCVQVQLAIAQSIRLILRKSGD